MASGQWRSPSDNGKTKDRLKYYMDMAKLAEKGKISCIFFADWYAGQFMNSFASNTSKRM